MNSSTSMLPEYARAGAFTFISHVSIGGLNLTSHCTECEGLERVNSFRSNRRPLILTDCKKDSGTGASAQESCDVCVPGADHTANCDMLPSAYMSMAKGG